MSEKPLVTWSNDEFVFPFLASQDTVWVANPANPVADQTGLIRKGETIWFLANQFGSGPAWQVAKLINNTVCFVQPHHFKPITP